MYTNIGCKYGGKSWKFSKIFGVTYSSINKTLFQKSVLSNEFVNPFSIRVRTKKPREVRISIVVMLYAHLLVWSAKYCYPIVYILSHFRFNLYEDALQASWVFQQVTQMELQKLLCLPRSIFIATTSKRFKEYGTMYIGIFLPSRNMHAWVIEDNMQTDEWDNYWILYQPLIMMKG